MEFEGICLASSLGESPCFLVPFLRAKIEVTSPRLRRLPTARSRPVVAYHWILVTQ